ncbi:NAD(P)/FAD-dependent oxidoreductase [Variovorax sp. PBL-E5]|uniref:NAD(P)/FAD-dependent oxidoreductase n=1 Tax=Variovorax sp. PBL-E5 TaxID=434014 RepID=UPI001318E427|nr:FAD-binding oxidoreductase [Variovorax sp. PBL-E5]VTU45652.1 Gamma-glutamylputrescine oxidoreductase [Variovorax sp. PBL-E5]
MSDSHSIAIRQSVQTSVERPGDGLDRSLWARTAPAAPALPVLRGSHRAEVVVVGAGYTGLATALALIEHGVQVAIVDAREPGFGASGRNGGQVIPVFKHEPQAIMARFGEEAGRDMIDMVMRSADDVFALIDKYGIACDAERTGWIQGARNAASGQVLHRRCLAWRKVGADARPLDADEIAQLSGTTHFRSGWLLGNAGSVNPLKYARGLASAAVGRGASLFVGSPVVRLESVDGAWRVATPEGELHARRVVLATNGYSTRLWPGLRESIVPLYSMQIATDPLPAALGASILPRRQTMTDDRHLVHYFRRDAAGRFVIGARGPFRPDPSAHDARRLIAMARRLYPQLDEVAFPFRWAGRVAMTPDFMPHLHRLAPGLTTALGFNGRGVAMTAAMGRVLAQACLDDGDRRLPYPVSALRPIPLHRLHRAGVQMMMSYYRLRDRLA